ncbi:VWA domain-containing protein [Escherichia coli]|nr:VWA domain-containing protein [Escherichia coli]
MERSVKTLRGSVLGYFDGSGSNTRRKPGSHLFGGNRNQPVFSVVKHGDTVQNRAGRFGFKATGGTPMAEAMWYAAFELTKTREERKMLIVVTDGQPQRAPACRSVIDLCERSDVEVIGIG